MPKVEVKKYATFSGHRDCVYTLEKTGQDNIFLSASGDGMVVQWDFKNPDQGTLLAKVENSVYALCYIPESNLLLVGQNFEGIHFIDLALNKEIRSLKLTDASIFDIKVYKNQIFVATGDGYVIVVDSLSNAIVKRVRLSEKSIRSLVIQEQGGKLITAASDNYIRIVDLDTLEKVQEFEAHLNSVFTLAFTADEKYLLSGSRDARFKVWDVNNNYQLYKEVVAHLFAVNHIAFSPDGRHFATCSMDKSVKIWDAVSFDLKKVIDKSRHAGHGTSVNKLLWSNYEDKLISVSDDRSIAIWDLTFNEQIQA